jgi:phosphate transport system permease protein
MPGTDRTSAYAVVLALALLALPPCSADAAGSVSARSHPLVAGSSTVFHFAAAVAERHPALQALVVPTGTGAGIAWFCEGLGPATPDIVMASRPMVEEELAACIHAGVAPLERVELGRDGIVLIASPGSALHALSGAELWRAIAARVPSPTGHEWGPNPYRTWAEVRPGLPETPIRVLGPPATSGTRDMLVSLVLRPACEAALAGRDAAPDERLHCGEVRRDGRWSDAGENDDALVAQITADAAALGVVGYGALVRNPGRVAALCIDGSCPSKETIGSGDYPLARPLFLYFKPAHAAYVPGLAALMDGFAGEEAGAEDGFLSVLGLVPAPVAATVTLHAGTGSPAEFGPNLRLAVLILAVLALLGVLVPGAFLARRAVQRRTVIEGAMKAAFAASTGVSGALLALVLATLLVPTISFFLQVAPLSFLAGTHWSPESAIRASQVVGEGVFGVLPVLLGSGLVALIALGLALPIALAASLYVFAWAAPRYRRGWQIGIRVAALVPTVIYGLFAALTVGPLVAHAAGSLGADAVTGSTLAAGIVVGIMLLPVLAMRISEALEAVPIAAAESALGLGATRWEAMRDVVMPGARAGIGAGILLALSRALGETMIVVMALGLVASWSLDVLASTSTLTAQMVTLMSGTHELDNVRTQLPFVLGLLLALIVLPINALALHWLRSSDANPSPAY